LAFWGDKDRDDEEAAPVTLKEIKTRGRDALREIHSERVIIATGPSFNTVLGLLALGAALGAGATLFLQRKESAAPETGASDAPDLSARVHDLTERAKHLAGRTREAVQTASEVLGPIVQDAIGEAKNAAQQTQDALKSDLQNAPRAETNRAETNRGEADYEEAKREVVATGSVAVGVPARGTVEVQVPSNAEVEVPAGTRPVEVTEVHDVPEKQ